jgi:hypothetical protein
MRHRLVLQDRDVWGLVHESRSRRDGPTARSSAAPSPSADPQNLINASPVNWSNTKLMKKNPKNTKFASITR